MRFPIPADTSLMERLRLFEKSLDDRYERVDAEVEKNRDNLDAQARLKTERAVINVIQNEFERLFEQELRS